MDARLCSKESLIAEASYKYHCVHSNRDRISNGQCFIFSITGKERTTLELVTANEKLIINQLKGRFYAKVSEELVHLINVAITGIVHKTSKPIISQYTHKYVDDDFPF